MQWHVMGMMRDWYTSFVPTWTHFGLRIGIVTSTPGMKDFSAVGDVLQYACVGTCLLAHFTGWQM